MFFTGLLLFLRGFSCFLDDAEKRFLTGSYIEKSIDNQSLLREAIVSNTLIFDRTELYGLNIYHAKVFLNTNVHEYYIDFITHNILLIAEKVDGMVYVRDCLIIKKQNAEAYLANGPVEIDGDYFDWDITVLVNHKWRAKFTDDISQAFKIDIQAKRIMPFVYNAIRLYSED
jgi:hypothetical protein